MPNTENAGMLNQIENTHQSIQKRKTTPGSDQTLNKNSSANLKHNRG